MKSLVCKVGLIIWVLLIALSSCFTAVANELPSATLKSVNDISLDASIIYRVEKMNTEILLSNETDFSSEISVVYRSDKTAFIKPDEISLLISSDNVFTGERETSLSVRFNFLF